MRKVTTVIGVALVLTLGPVATVGRPQPAPGGKRRQRGPGLEPAGAERHRGDQDRPDHRRTGVGGVHTAIYDAWAIYDPVAVDSRGRLRASPQLRQPAAERTLDNKTKAVSFAAYAALVDLFPAQEQQDAFAAQMRQLGYAIDGVRHLTRGRGGHRRCPGGVGLPPPGRRQPAEQLRRLHRL